VIKLAVIGEFLRQSVVQTGVRNQTGHRALTASLCVTVSIHSPVSLLITHFLARVHFHPSLSGYAPVQNWPARISDRIISRGVAEFGAMGP